MILPTNPPYYLKDELVARIDERISAWTFLPKGIAFMKLCFVLSLFAFSKINL